MKSRGAELLHTLASTLANSRRTSLAMHVRPSPRSWTSIPIY